MKRFVVGVIVRMDRGEVGVALPEICEMAESPCPQLTRQQCQKIFTQAARPRYKKELTGIVIAQ